MIKLYITKFPDGYWYIQTKGIWWKVLTPNLAKWLGVTGEKGYLHIGVEDGMEVTVRWCDCGYHTIYVGDEYEAGVYQALLVALGADKLNKHVTTTTTGVKYESC